MSDDKKERVPAGYEIPSDSADWPEVVGWDENGGAILKGGSRHPLSPRGGSGRSVALVSPTDREGIRAAIEKIKSEAKGAKGSNPAK